MKRNQRGLSLVIVAILLVVVGTAASMVLTRKEREANWHPKTGSQTNILKLKEALIAFERTKHRLPCVAPRNVLPGATGYGDELANCAGGAAATGGTVRLNLGSGVYVRIGAVPTKTLGLSEVAGDDEWKNRILYAVTESLTDPYQFTNGTGALTVKDGAGATTTSTAAFVVLSHGADGKGAYGAKGASIGKLCASAAGKDQANCDDVDAIFTDTSLENTAGATFYDDIVAWDPVDGVAQATNRPCTLGTTGNASWSPGCTNNTWTNMLSGTGGQAVNNTNTGTHVGNATLACDNGALVYSGESCFRHCTASIQSWSGGSCAGNVPLVNHTASSGTIINTNAGYTGDAVFSCTDGVLSPTSSNCAASAPPPPGDCAAQAVSWNTDCTGNAPLLTDGSNTSVSNTAPGYSGSVTVTCNAGVLIQSGASCNPVASCTNGYVEDSGQRLGNVFQACCNGVDIAASDPGPDTVLAFGVCSGVCAGDSRTWTVGGHTCTANVPAGTAWGQSGTATDNVGPKQGSASFVCNGTLAASPNPGATCAPFVPPCTVPNCSTTHPTTGNPLCLGDDTSREFASTCSEYKCCSGVLTITNLSPACPGVDSINSGVCFGSPCGTGCMFTDAQNCAATCIADGNFKIDTYGWGKPRYQCVSGSMVYINDFDPSWIPPPSCP